MNRHCGGESVESVFKDYAYDLTMDHLDEWSDDDDREDPFDRFRDKEDVEKTSMTEDDSSGFSDGFNEEF